MAALDEAGADLRGDQPLAVEDADRVTAEADEQRSDDMIGGQRLEQRLELHDLVLALVREPERRSDDDQVAGGLDSRLSAGVGGATALALQRRHALADVLATDEAG